MDEEPDLEDQFFRAFVAGWSRAGRYRPIATDTTTLWTYYLEWLAER